MNPSDPKTGWPAPSDDEQLAALHALGALDPAAAAALEARIDEERALEQQVQAWLPTVGDLGLLAEPVAPPPDLRARLLDRVRNTAAAAPTNPPATPFSEVVQQQPTRAEQIEGFRYLGGDEQGFTPLALPGITARTLHRDEQAGYATVLVRMAPGTSYPAHRHGGDEECYVLEGDLQVGDALHMTAGDYQVAARDSIHPVQRTHGGCLLLLRSSLHDELVGG